MSKLGDFAAFKAAVELHKERGNTNILEQIYQEAKTELENQTTNNGMW